MTEILEIARFLAVAMLFGSVLLPQSRGWIDIWCVLLLWDGCRREECRSFLAL